MRTFVTLPIGQRGQPHWEQLAGGFTVGQVVCRVVVAQLPDFRDPAQSGQRGQPLGTVPRRLLELAGGFTVGQVVCRVVVAQLAGLS